MLETVKIKLEKVNKKTQKLRYRPSFTVAYSGADLLFEFSHASKFDELCNSSHCFLEF
jgi:hypothetical protein